MSGRRSSQYAEPDLRQAIWTIASSLIPYFVLFYLALRSVEISLWLTVPLCILAAGFMTRTFIIFHDCGHGSFFKSQRANDWVGIITGLIDVHGLPQLEARARHPSRHGGRPGPPRRGRRVHDDAGGVSEGALVREGRLWVMRNPVTMFLIGAPLMFLLVERIPPRNGTREIAGVWWTNLAVVLIVTAMGLSFGWRAYLIVQRPDAVHRQHRRGVAVLRAAPVPGCVLAAARGLELPGRQPAGQFVLQAAEAAAMVQRQHRIPSHPSSEFEDPKLQPGASVSGESDCSTSSR